VNTKHLKTIVIVGLVIIALCVLAAVVLARSDKIAAIRIPPPPDVPFDNGGPVMKLGHFLSDNLDAMAEKLARIRIPPSPDVPFDNGGPVVKIACRMAHVRGVGYVCMNPDGSWYRPGGGTGYYGPKPPPETPPPPIPLGDWKPNDQEPTRQKYARPRP